MDKKPYHKFTNAQRKKYLNGCGAFGFKFNLPFNNACLRHDYYYTIGITRSDRKKADKMFKRDMLKIIDKMEKKRWRYKILCYIAYFLVRTLGTFRFYNQNEFRENKL